MSKKISREEVAKHNKEHDRWVIINNKVYNVSEWQFEHPGMLYSKSFTKQPIGGQDPIIETAGCFNNLLIVRKRCNRRI